MQAQALTGSPQVVIENLTKQYGTLRALGGVTFGVNTGEWVALMGPSGSGKRAVSHCRRKRHAGAVFPQRH